MTKFEPLATRTAEDYATAKLPELREVVPGLFTEGATVLAGSPKTGKSWLALGVAVSVAGGGKALGTIAVERREVLYLALEDGPRRLQGRLKKLVGASGRPYPTALHIAERCPRMDLGGKEAVEELAAVAPERGNGRDRHLREGPPSAGAKRLRGGLRGRGRDAEARPRSRRRRGAGDPHPQKGGELRRLRGPARRGHWLQGNHRGRGRSRRPQCDAGPRRESCTSRAATSGNAP